MKINRKKNKKQYIAVLVLKQERSYNIISKHKITDITENFISVKINNKLQNFLYDITKPNLIKNLLNIYYIDINTRKQVSFKSSKEKLDGNLLDLVISKHIIRDMIKSTEGNSIKDQIWYLIVGGMLGGIIGGLIGYIIAII